MASPSYKFIHKLQGKRVLIFGGTSGIGYAVAEGCIEHGSAVIISGSNAAKLQTTVERLKSSYPSLPSSQVTTHACDQAWQKYLRHRYGIDTVLVLVRY
jgi:NAD(P)-dependent dehydrogenase (short-subunit alcohol dehydrogenase family)